VHGHDLIDGKVVILVPKFQSKWVHNLYPRTEKLFYKIRLDELGSITWLNISGENNVAGITLAVQQQLGSKAQEFEEAEIRIQKFMTLLYDWRYITFRQLL
jgi:hypothetical protein